jgi:hypothetical protein
VRLTVPELTHDREVLHVGLAALALAEWVSLHGPGLFGRPGQATLVAVAWTVLVVMLGASASNQPHAVELIVTALASMAVSSAGVVVTGVGTTYWSAAHPVGTLVTAVRSVTTAPALVLTGVVVTERALAWWCRRRTTPEERILEGER